MSASHDHDTAGSNQVRLGIAFAITATVLAAEVVGAWITGSLALLVDAGHMLTDAAGLLMALVVLHAGAALYHHYVQRDSTLSRMLPRRRASPSPIE